MHTQPENSLSGAGMTRPQRVAEEVSQGEVNATAAFTGDLQTRLSDINDSIEDHERALRALATRRSMVIAALSQLDVDQAPAEIPGSARPWSASATGKPLG